MGEKNSSLNAGSRETRGELILTLFRTLLGTVVLGFAWLGLGWALAVGMRSSLGLVAWTVVVGPIVLPISFWLGARLGRGRLRRLELAKEPGLAHEFFRGILHRPGPRPRVWLRASSEPVFLWFENPWLGTSRQEVVVTTEWLKMDETTKIRDWQNLWASIERTSRPERLLRTLQMCLWFGMLSPLEVLAWITNFLFSQLGFADLPDLRFLFQRFCWALKSLWFGVPEDPGKIPELTNVAGFARPAVLSSLLWGVWFQIPSRVMHPIWTFVTHSESSL